MKDSIGYILTSFFLVIVFDAIVIETFVSFLAKIFVICHIRYEFVLVNLCKYLSNVGYIAVARVYFVYVHGT